MIIAEYIDANFLKQLLEPIYKHQDETQRQQADESNNNGKPDIKTTQKEDQKENQTQMD